MAGANSEQMQQESARRYSFYKKRMKAPKISKRQLHQEFVHRGWDTCSFDFDGESSNFKSVWTKSKLSSEELFETGSKIENEIIFSPSKFENNSKVSVQKKGLCFRKKSMLVEIGNIKAEFSNNQSKSFYKDDCSNSKYNSTVHKEKQKRKSFENSEGLTKKLTTSMHFKVQDMQAAFEIKKTHIYDKLLASSQTGDELKSLFQTSKSKQYRNNMNNELFKSLSDRFSSSFSGGEKHSAQFNTWAKSLFSKNCHLLSSKPDASKHSHDSSYFDHDHEVSGCKNSDFINVSEHVYSVSNLRAFLQEKSTSGDKGSSWVQSIKWSEISCLKDENLDCWEQTGNKKFRNLLLGGLAEQMLKLQRREKSDKVIWEHKAIEIKKKGSRNFLVLKLIAVIHFGEIIVTKCSLIESHKADSGNDIQPHDTTEMAVSSFMKELPQLAAKTYIVLFRRSLFYKMHLKQNSIFTLFQPWHIISTPSVSHPVILCTYFIDILVQQLQKSEVKNVDQEDSVNNIKVMQAGTKQEIAPIKNADFRTCTVLENSVNIHNFWGKCISMLARVQRIWKDRICCRKVADLMKIEDYLCFSLLLQTKEGTFFILKIKSYYGCLPKFWSNLISNGEGVCYVFHSLKITNRYDLQKYPQLFKLLETYQKTQFDNNEEVVSQNVCYELIPNSLDDVPNEVEDTLPIYCNFKIFSLALLHEMDVNQPFFSCIGKVIYHIKDNFFLTDESLSNSQVKSIRLRFLHHNKIIEDSLVGKTVLIKEAMFNGEFLLIDEFSTCKIISVADYSWLSKLHQRRLKATALISVQDIASLLSFYTKKNDLVYVKGIVKHVDVNSAISWLECSFCYKENLMQDANSIIYCEDCSCVVPKPILNFKMEVTVSCPYVSDATVLVLLLPSTIRTILKLSDDSYQPHCNIDDILNKEVGSLICYTRDCKVLEGKRQFHLTEVKFCV